MLPAISVLLADDHPLVMESIKNAIKWNPGLRVTHMMVNGQEVLDFLHRDPGPLPDVLVLDINMPKKNGLECMEEINTKYPWLKVVFLTIYQEAYVLTQLKELGAKAIVLKNTSTDRLVDVIMHVHSGGQNFEDVQEVFDEQPDQGGKKSLSKREREIIKHIGNGLSNLEMSKALSLSEYTIQTHRRNIMKKLGFTNIAQLAAFAKSSGII